jgi:exopolysaccharide production protein ExoZ
MRIFVLDYLRAILAVGILIAHFALWSYGPKDVSNVSMRLEIYRVPMFYLLSGLTLGYIYANKISFNIPDLSAYVLKRIKRLAPMFYFTTFLTILISWKMPPPGMLINNLTGFVAFYKWDEIIVNGGWSIGNEFFFYLMFPVLIFIYRQSKYLFAVAMASVLVVFIYFAFFQIDASHLFVEEWKNYTNPLNQLFLFASGVSISLFLKDVKVSLSSSLILIITGVVVFYIYPISGDRIRVITGLPRLVFSMACIMIMIGIFNIRFKAPAILHSILMMVAAESYSIYLLHPICYRGFMRVNSLAVKLGFVISTPLVLMLSGVSTIVLIVGSRLTYKKVVSLFKQSDPVLESA